MERARYKGEIQEGIEGRGRRERWDMALFEGREGGESGYDCEEGLWGSLGGGVYWERTPLPLSPSTTTTTPPKCSNTT